MTFGCVGGGVQSRAVIRFASGTMRAALLMDDGVIGRHDNRVASDALQPAEQGVEAAV